MATAGKEVTSKAKKGTVKMVGIAKAKKTKREPTVSLHDSKYMGSEPTWDTEKALKFTTEEFDHLLRKSLRYYNYFYTQKEMKKHVVTWVQNNMKLDKKQLSAFITSSPAMIPMPVCGLVRAEAKGMPMRKEHKEYIVTRVMQAIASPTKEVESDETTEKKAVYVPTIQDRLAEKTAEIIGELEAQVDNAFTKKPTSSVYDYLTTANLAQAQVGKVRSHFQKQIDELSLFVEGKDEQLNEAYGFLKNVDIKRVGAFYVKLMDDLTSYTAAKKAVKKVKAKRPVNKDKLVAKVKFMKESKELKIVSAPIIDVLGAQAVWVYHTKSRKLGKYVAADHSSLSIKGTSIINFSEDRSVQKTLRKPTEQIAEFMKAGKVPLRTFLKDIKAVETKLNGRLSADILILKIEQ